MSEIPLVPKDGQTLFTLLINRISTDHQDPRSLEDQSAYCQEYVHRLFGGRVEFTIISGQGSGERLDRDEYRRAFEEVKSRRFDVCITEDLARVCRRTEAMSFIGACEDAGTRFVAINDHIDTARGDWKLNGFFASIKHELANRDTSDRIRRSLRNRHVNGGVLQFVIYGYEKPNDASSDSELTLRDDAKEVYRIWFEKLRDGATYAEVADWLNGLAIPTGRYCRNKQWGVAMVARVTHNPILKGWRVRNRVVSKRVNETGRRKAVKAPQTEILVRKCPHLAAFSEEYFDETITIVDARNGKFRRRRVDGRDPLDGVPKKRSAWPGQHVRCGICGRPMRYGGHGQAKHLVCQGAIEYKCWNGVTVDGPMAVTKIVQAIRTAIMCLPGFDDALAEKVRSAAVERETAERRESVEVERKLRAVVHQLDNVAEAIKRAGHSQTLLDSLAELEAQQASLESRQRHLSKEVKPPVELPSIDELRQQAEEVFQSAVTDSPEFARWMKSLVTRFEVLPVRGRYRGLPAARAYFRLSLVSLVPPDVAAAAPEALTRDMVVDLFEPPKPLAYRERILALRATGMKLRDIAHELGLHLPEVQRALAISKKMKEDGVDDPYEVMAGPSDDNVRLRRHRHARYAFEPLPGYPRLS